jgi:hypothetical protein
MPSTTTTVKAPLFYFSQLPLSNWTPEKHNVQIENVRGKVDAYLLDEAGFQFFTLPPATNRS